MRHYFIAVVLSLALCAGCEWPVKDMAQAKQVAKQAVENAGIAAQKAKAAADKAAAQSVVVAEKLDILTDAVNRAEPVASALETATGKTLNADTVSKAEHAAGTFATNAANVGMIAKVATAIPGPHQPIAGGIATIAAALAGVAGAIGTLISRRKTARTEKALTAVMAGANNLSGAGKAIAAAASARGVGDLVEAKYRESVAT